MEDLFKILKGIGIFIMIAPPIIGLLMIATGNGSSGGGSWKQKRERYEREKSERIFKDDQQKKLHENTVSYQSFPAAQSVYLKSSSRNQYAELWDECEDMEAVLSDAGIDHDDLSYPMEYHELIDLRDEYQSLLEDNDIDY